MAEYGGEQYKKQEGDHQTDEHVQNQLHSTTVGHEEGKQGVVEKIKEKLPGGDHGSDEKKADEHTPYATNTVGDGYGNKGEEGHEKKGLMDKIKDMLPGGDHGSEKHTTHDTVGGGEHGKVEEEEHEKLMDQIKDTVAKTG